MNYQKLIRWAVGTFGALMLAGCVAVTPYDYTNYRLHPPRSILVLPPLNESTDIHASYSYLSTVTSPLAELGYYVYPVAVMDQLLKENGLPTPGEMHQVPLNKIQEIIGADAVMYITVVEYGTKYQVLNSATTVRIKARLVDTRTGLLLWEGAGMAQENSGSGDPLADLIGALVVQVLSSSTDQAHILCPSASRSAFCTKDQELPFGPYHPKTEADE